MLSLRGFEIHDGFLDRAAQEAVLEGIRAVVARAPLFRPQTPYGKAMSVRITAAGDYGWYADRSGYRYVPTHPDGQDWPPIPAPVLAIWEELVGPARRPECCLINYYDVDAKMGMHQDKDEADFSWPVVSVSLGDEALFRMGNAQRGGKTESIWLRSGDVVVMGGAARRAYHGVDRIRPGTSSLLRAPGRINLTLRMVT
ncbi:MAG: alpha-ketoglutarate-dependent dioxygenase AlkB family protein [Sulfitobacter sp.]